MKWIMKSVESTKTSLKQRPIKKVGRYETGSEGSYKISSTTKLDTATTCWRGGHGTTWIIIISFVEGYKLRQDEEETKYSVDSNNAKKIKIDVDGTRHG